MSTPETDRREAMRYHECQEEVSRQHEAQPCEKTAVALRLDPTEGTPYPVCAYHSRADMVPLSAIAADLEQPLRVKMKALCARWELPSYQVDGWVPDLAADLRAALADTEVTT